MELDFCKAAPNKGGLKEEKGYQVSWIIHVIFRFWKPFITFKMFEEQGYPVCGIALCFFNTTFENLARHSDTFWKYLTTSVSGLDVYELHIQKVSKYFNFCRQRYHLVFKTYDTPNVCFYLEQHRKWLSFIESSMSSTSTRNLYLQKHILKLRICETRLEIVYVASNIFFWKYSC